MLSFFLSKSRKLAFFPPVGVRSGSWGFLVPKRTGRRQAFCSQAGKLSLCSQCARRQTPAGSAAGSGGVGWRVSRRESGGLGFLSVARAAELETAKGLAVRTVGFPVQSVTGCAAAMGKGLLTAFSRPALQGEKQNTN